MQSYFITDARAHGLGCGEFLAVHLVLRRQVAPGRGAAVRHHAQGVHSTEMLMSSMKYPFLL